MTLITIILSNFITPQDGCTVKVDVVICIVKEKEVIIVLHVVVWNILRS